MSVIFAAFSVRLAPSNSSGIMPTFPMVPAIEIYIYLHSKSLHLRQAEPGRNSRSGLGFFFCLGAGRRKTREKAPDSYRNAAAPSCLIASALSFVFWRMEKRKTRFTKPKPLSIMEPSPALAQPGRRPPKGAVPL